MRLRRKLFLIIFLSLSTLSTSAKALGNVEASEDRQLDFEIFDRGEVSGYGEETCLVAKTVEDWIHIWENHTRPYLSTPNILDVNFSENMVACAFMGRCSTAGYSICIEKAWVEENVIYIEVVKHNPLEGLLVAQVLTFPYVFALLPQSDLEVVFVVVGDEESGSDKVLPEFSAALLVLAAFTSISAVTALLARRTRMRWHAGRALERMCLENIACTR